MTERLKKPLSVLCQKERNNADFHTVMPAVKLRLQPLDVLFQVLVLLLLFLIFPLPLLCRQLQVHRRRVLDGLCSETQTVCE